MQLQAGKKSHGSLVSGRCRWFPILVDRSRRPVSREPLSWSAALLRAAPQPGPAKLPRCPGRKADYWYRFAELSRRSESWAPSDRIPNLPYLVPSCSLHRSEMLFGWERYFRRVPAVHAVAPLIRALESAPGWDPAKPQLPPVFRWQARGRLGSLPPEKAKRRFSKEPALDHWWPPLFEQHFQSDWKPLP